MTRRADDRQDFRLCDRLRADDQSSLAEILRQNGGPVLALLRRRFRGVLQQEDLEDVLSIGLYRLWIHRRQYDADRASLRVWLYRICENAARDVLRLGWQKARAREVSASDEALSEARHRSSMPLESAGNTDGEGPHDVPTALQQDLREILEELPEAQRRILLADAATRDTVACSQRLGTDLGLPAATVRVYRKRAIARVRSALAGRGYDLSTTDVNDPAAPLAVPAAIPP